MQTHKIIGEIREVRHWDRLGCQDMLIDVVEFLLQSRFRNPIEIYYNWIAILCIMYDVWCLGSISWPIYVFTYFDMFYIQWHHLAKKDLWSKVYMMMMVCKVSKSHAIFDKGWYTDIQYGDIISLYLFFQNKEIDYKFIKYSLLSVSWSQVKI
jgi:hypothetical protein